MLNKEGGISGSEDIFISNSRLRLRAQAFGVEVEAVKPVEDVGEAVSKTPSSVDSRLTLRAQAFGIPIESNVISPDIL